MTEVTLVKRKLILIAFAICILVIAFTFSHATTSAQSGGGYDLTWSTIDGGGGMFSTGGAYSLGGTIGQADAGTLNGGSYTLAGGFWGSSVANLLHLYLPLILK